MIIYYLLQKTPIAEQWGFLFKLVRYTGTVEYN